MREEEELTERARRSREETQELREESGLGRDDEDDSQAKARDGEPWAKTSSGDAEHVADDDDQ